MARAGRWEVLADSDVPEYGGSGYLVPALFETTETPWHGRDQSALLTLAPLARPDTSADGLGGDDARAVCFHLHCYQPERADPWLDLVNPEPSAFRITTGTSGSRRSATAQHHGRRAGTRQAAPRVGRRLRVASFDVVRTLHGWLSATAPDVDAVVRAAGRRPDGKPSGAALASRRSTPSCRSPIRTIARFSSPGALRITRHARVRSRRDVAARNSGRSRHTRHALPSRHQIHAAHGSTGAPCACGRRHVGRRERQEIDPGRAYLVSLPGGGSMTVVFGHGPLSPSSLSGTC